ncbi:hypothetical protein BLA29_003965 [Euroglyphus maynei]|uniref:Uncharacterized protein n=1 Tax=Euroglyphus maynei TaxID=6958 RepID=A0A1Y3BEU8_EURMA|nr:hypothetical protein BLA29_003965 [Euroglyphus maynei]
MAIQFDSNAAVQMVQFKPLIETTKPCDNGLQLDRAHMVQSFSECQKYYAQIWKLSLIHIPKRKNFAVSLPISKNVNQIY